MGFNTSKQVSNSIDSNPSLGVSNPADYFGLKLSGQNDADITKNLSVLNAHPILLPKDKAQEGYAKFYTGQDGKFDQGKFDQDYATASQGWKNYNDGLFDSTARNIPKDFSPVHTNVIQQYLYGKNISKPVDTDLEDQIFASSAWGNQARVMTDSQNAWNKGVYLDNGKMKPFSSKAIGLKEDPNNPDLTPNDLANGLYDAEGKKLNLEPDPTGAGWMYVARTETDKDVSWNQVLTAQGPQPMTEGFWTAAWNKLMNEIRYKPISEIGSLVEMVTPETDLTTDVVKWGKRMQDIGQLAMHPSSLEEQESGHTQWGSLVGSGLGFIGKIWAGGSVGELVGGSAGANIGSRVVMGMSMADSYHQAAKLAGVTGTKDLLGYAGMFLGGAALMGVASKGSSWFSSAFIDSVGKGELDKIISESIQKDASDLFGKIPADLTKEEADILQKSALEKVFHYASSVPKAALKGASGILNASSPFVSHTAQAGVEMSLFTMMDNSMKTLSDYTASKDASVGHGLFKEGAPGVGDFFSRMFDGVSDSFKEGAIMGLATAMLNPGSYRNDQSRLTKQDYIVKGLDGELSTRAQQMYEAKLLDKDFINAQTGEMIRPGEIDENTGLRPKSLNDLAWENFQNDMALEKQSFVDSGLKKWRDEYSSNPKYKDRTDLIDKTTADYLSQISDPNKIASEGLDALYKKREATRSLHDEKSSESQKQEAMKIIDLADKKIEQIKSGEYANELLRHGLVKGNQIELEKYTPLDAGKSSLGSAISDNRFVSGKQVDELNASIDNAVTSGVAETERIANESGLLNSKTIPDIISSIPVGAGIDPEVNSRVNSMLSSAKGLSVSEKSKQGVSDALRGHIDANVNALMEKLSLTKDIEVDDIDQVENKVNSMPESADKAQYLRDIRQINDLIKTSSEVGALKEIAGGISNAKEQAYLSENTGTTQAPVFKSFDSTLDDFAKSNLNSSADFMRLMDVQKSIERNLKSLFINGQVLSKLKDNISKLNDNNRVLASDLDLNNKESIASKLQQAHSRTQELINKSAAMSEYARRSNEFNFKHNDLAVRSSLNQLITNDLGITTSKSFAKNIAESSALQKQYIALQEEFYSSNNLSKEEFEQKFSELEGLQDKIITKNLIIEGNLHNWISENPKKAQDYFHAVTSKKGKFGYTQDVKGNIDGVLGDTNAFVFDLSNDSNGNVSYNHLDYLGDKSTNKAMQFNIFVNHYNTIKRISSSDFYTALDKTVSDQKAKAGDAYKAPSYQQREALKHVTGFLVDSSNAFKIDKPYSGNIQDFYSNFNFNEVYVQGFAGTGKTTEVIGNALSILEKLKKANNKDAPESKTLVLAPSSPQLRGLKESIDKFLGVSSKRKHATIEDYLKGSVTQSAPDLIVIDESSELSKDELLSIREKAKQNNTKILWLGDSSQIPSNLSQSLPDIAFGVEKTTPLTEVFRSGVYDISRIQQQYREVSHNMIEQPAVLLPTQYTVDANGHYSSGVKLRDRSSEAAKEQLDDFVSDIKDANLAQKTVFIVSDDAQRAALISKISTEYGLNPSVIESKIRTILKGEYTFKGLQSDRVYVSLAKEPLKNNYNKGQLTAASRAISFLDIVTDKVKFDLPPSTKVEALTDNTEAYRVQEAQRIAQYSNSQSELINQQAKTLNDEVPVKKDDKKSDEFIFDRQDKEQEQKQQKKEDKENSSEPTVDAPVKGRPKKAPQELSSINHGNKTITSGMQVVDSKGRVVRVTKIEQSGNNVMISVDGAKKRMSLGRFVTNYSAFEFSKVDDIVSGEQPVTSNRALKKSIERAKDGQHTFISAVSMFAEHSPQDILHRQIKSDILQDIYQNKPSGLIKKYYKTLDFFNYQKGIQEKANHAVTIELNTSKPEVLKYLKDKGVSDADIAKMKIIAILPEGPGKNMSFSELSNLSSKSDDQILDHLNVRVSDRLTPDEFEYEKAKFSDRMNAIRKMNAGDTEYDLGPAMTKGASAGSVEYDPGNYKPLSSILNAKEFSNVHFKDPVFIFDPLEEGFDPNSSSTIKQNGEFEAGFYLIYSHDKAFGNPGMIKLRSAPITNTKVVTDVIRNFIRKPIKTSPINYYSSEGGYYDYINKFLSANRYFFAENKNGKWGIRSEFKGLVTVNERKAKDGRVFTNFKVNILDSKGQPVDEAKRQDTLTKLASAIDSADIDVSLHDASLISPGNNELIDFENNKDTLYTNVTRINQPTVYVDRIVREATASNEFITKEVSEQGYDAEDVLQSVQEDEPKDWKNKLEKFRTEGLSQDEAYDKNGISEEIQDRSDSRDQKARDYYSLAGIFHNANEVASIRKVIAARIINESIVGRNLESLNTLSQAKDVVFEQVKKEREKLLNSGKTYSVVRDGSNVNLRITDLDRSDMASLKGQAKTDYVNFNLGRSDVFDKFVKNIFPKTVIGEDVFVKESLFSVDEDGHLSYNLGDSESSQGESSIQTGNNMKNPLRNASDAVKLFLNSVNYNEYGFDANGKRVVKPAKALVSISPMLMHKLLVHAANASRFERTPDQKGMSPMQLFADNLHKNAVAGVVFDEAGIKTPSKLSNILFSLYDTLFHVPSQGRFGEKLDEYKKDGRYSYAAIAHDAEHISSVEGIKDLSEKSKQAANVLSSIYNFYYSLTSSSFDKASMGVRDNELKYIQTQAKEWADISGKIKNSIIQGLYDVTGNTLKLRDSKKVVLFDTFDTEYAVPTTKEDPSANYFNRANLTQKDINDIISEWRSIDPGKKEADIIQKKTANTIDGYRYKADGIYKVTAGKETKLISRAGNKLTAEKSFTPQETRDILRVFGLGKSHISNATINAFFNEGANDAQIREKQLAYKDITGADISEGGITKNKLMDTIDKFMRSVVAPTDADMDALSPMMSRDAGEFREGLVSNDKMAMPTAHWPLINDISIVESYNRGNDYLRFAYTADGRKVWLDTNSTQLRDLFGYSTKETLAGKGLADSFASDHAQGLVMHSPSVNFDGKILNPLLDPNGSRKIVQMRMVGALERGSKAKSYNQLSGKEWYMLNTEAGFIDALISHKTGTGEYKSRDFGLRYKMPMMNMGTFGDLVTIEYESKANKQPVVIDASGKKAAVNWDHFKESFINMFEIQKNKQRISQEKMISFIEKKVISGELNLDRKVYSNYLESKELFLDNPEQLDAFIQEHIVKHASYPKFLDDLRKSSDLHGNRDYKYDDKTKGISLGNDPLMEFTDKAGNNYNKLFSSENYKKIDAALKANMDVVPVIKDIVGPRMANYIHDMIQEGVSPNERSLDFFSEAKSGQGYYVDSELAPGSSIENTAGYLIPASRTKPARSRIYNPMYEGFYLSYLEHAFNLGDITLGSPGQFKSLVDLSKYGYNLNTPRASFDTSNPYGLSDKSLYLIVTDDKQHYDVVGKDVVATDGWGIQVSAHSWLEHNSSGGQYGNVKTVIGPKKQIFSHTNTVDGSRELIKNSWQDTAALRKMSDRYANLERFMLSYKQLPGGGTLYDKLVEFGFNDEKLANYIAENDLHEYYIAKILPESSFKSGAYAVHDATMIGQPGYEINPIQIENKYNGTVLDPNKDIKEDTAAMLHQLMAQMQIGENNSTRSKDMMSSFAKIVERNISTISSDVAKSGGFQSWVKSIGIEAARSMPSVGNFSEYLNSLESSVQPQPIDDRLRTIFLSRLNDGLRPRITSGGSYVQNPGHGIDVFRATTDVPEWGVRAGKSVLAGNAMKLKISKYPEFPVNVFTLDPEGLSHIKIAEKVIPGEAVMGFKDFEKFGFNDNGPQDGLDYRNFTLDQMMSFESGGKAIRYDDLGDTPEQRMTAAQKLMDEGGLSQDTPALMALHNMEVEKGATVQKGLEAAGKYEKIFQWYENLMDHNKILASRIPSSKTASGNIYSVIEYNNDASNTIFTSPKKNILDDSDYDVDELRVYMKQRDKEGNLISSETDEGDKNRILTNAMEYYQDKTNVPMYMSPVSTESIETLLDKRDADKHVYGTTEQAFDVRSNKDMFVRNMMGSETMGIFVNSIKSYSQLFAAHQAETSSHFNIDLFGQKYNKFSTKGLNNESVIDTLASILQSALDNPKKVLLGRMFGNTTTADTIAGMTIIGVPKEKVIDFISSDTTREVLGDVLDSKNMDSKTRSVSQAIGSWDAAYRAIDKQVADIISNKKLDQKQKHDQIEDLRKNFKSVSGVDISGSLQASVLMGNEKLDPLSIDEMTPDMTFTNKPVNIEQFETNYDFTPTIDFIAGKLNDIENLRKAMLVGQGIQRMGKLLSFTQGIKSNQWDIYRLNRDINHILGGPKEFLETRPTTPMIYGKKLSWAGEQPSDLEANAKDEVFINDFIDFNKVIDNSPNMQVYLKTLDFYNKQVKDNFIAEHPVINSLVSGKLESIRIKDLAFEDQFKAIKAAKWNMLSSMYLQDMFSKESGNNFSLIRDTNDRFIGENYVSTPTGQAHFIAQLPFLIEDIKANPEKYNSANPDAIRNNYFLNKLDVAVVGNGDKTLSLSDNFYYTDREKSALHQFASQLGSDTGIPNLEQMLFVHNLIKNGLRTYRGDFTEYLSKDHMVEFGRWLQEKHDILNGDQNAEEFISLSKRIEDSAQPFFVNSKDLIPFAPGKTSDFANDYIPELKIDDTAKGRAPETGRLIANVSETHKLEDYPDYIKAFSKREGVKTSAEHIFKLDRQTGVYSIVENKYSDLVNNWVDGSETYNKTFHSLPMYMADELNRDPSKVITIKVNKGNYYQKGLYYLKDGSVAQIQMSGKDQVIVSRVPEEKTLASIDDEFVNDMNSRQEDYNFEQYQNAPTKRAGLESVVKHSMILPNRYLAKALLESAAGKYIDTGMLKWSTKGSDPLLSKQSDNTAALFGTKSKNVILNQAKVTDAAGFERRFLHEMLHNHTEEVINSLPENRTFAQQKFVDDLIVVYDHVKANMTADQLSSYGMTNLHEFVAEGFTNINFQKILNSIDASPNVKSPVVPSAWRQFVDSIKSLFNLNGYKRVTASSLDQVMALSTDLMEQGRTENMDMAEDVLASKDEKKEYSFIGPAKDIKDIGEVITGINLKEHKEDDVHQLMGRMEDAMRRNYSTAGNKYTYFANGKEYTVDDINSSSEIRGVAKTIIADQVDYESNLRDQVMKFASTGDPSHLDKTTKDNVDLIENIVQMPLNSKIMTYSDLKVEYPQLHSDIFKDYEPLVIVQQQEGKLRVSMTDVTSKHLMTRIGRDHKGYISDDVIRENPNILDDAHLRLFKDELGVRKFNMLLAVMDMKHRNPDVTFDNFIVANVVGRGAMVQGVHLSDYISEMNTILHAKGTYEALPENVKAIADDANLSRPDHFQDDYFGALLNGYRQRMDLYERINEGATAVEIEKSRGKYLENNFLFNKLNQYNQGHEVFKQDVKNIIEQRLFDLANRYKGNQQMMDMDQEYVQLTKALLFVDKKGAGLNENKWGIDMKSISVYTKGNYSLAHPVAQWYRYRTMKSLDTIMNLHVDGFKKEFDSQLDKINKIYQKSANFDIVAERIKDIGYKRFERLFIRDNVTDNNNNVHNVNTYEIHFKYKDSNGKEVMHPKTAEALKKNQITPEEVEFGGFVVKKIRDSFIENRMSMGIDYDTAKKFYESNWKDGMIPIMKSRASEKIFTKNWKAGLSQWIQRYSNSNELYDYMSLSTDNSPHKIASMFSYQMNSNPFGSKEREIMIGLEYDNSKGMNRKIVSGKTSDDIAKSITQNESGVEKNLEVLMNYFMMNHYSKMELDKTLPVYHGTMALLNSFENSKGEKLSNTMQYVKTMTEFIVKGERKGGDDRISIPNSMGPGGKNYTMSFNDLINNTTALTATSVINGNIFADLKNFGVNGLNTASFAAAQSASGGKFFGSKEWKDAIAVWHTNPRLAAALTDEYRMASMDRGAIMNSRRYSKTKKQIGNYELGYGQFAGDWMHRGLGLIAQMMKDGAYSAHSLDSKGNLVYDIKKDKRFYSNGVLTENGKVLLEEKKIQLEQEGVPLKNGTISRAYDSRERQSVKAIVDKYIMGAYDEQGKRNVEQWALGKLVAVMKRYLFDKAEVLYATPYQNDTIGRYEIEDVTVGGVTSKEAVWKGTEIEGVIQSMFGLIKDARKISELGVKDYWNEQSDIRRFNIVQTTQNLAVVASMVALAPAMFGEDDKDLNSRHANFMKTKMYQTMMFSFGDLIAGNNPQDYWKSLNSPFFAVTQVGKLADFVEACLTLNTKNMQTTAHAAFGVYRTGEAAASLFSSDKPKKNKNHHKQLVK